MADSLLRNAYWLLATLGLALGILGPLRIVGRERLAQSLKALTLTLSSALGGVNHFVPVASLAVTPALLTVAAPFALAIAGAAVGRTTALKTLFLELPEPLRADSANHKLILFIHGWNGDAQGTWRQFPQIVLGDSTFRDFNLWSLDYPTYMLKRQLSITQMSEYLRVQLLDVTRTFQRYDTIVVIAHSMGGLVAREIAMQAFLRGVPRPFDRIIAISSPHDGSDAAALASALGISRKLTADMRQTSDYLRDHNVDWNAFAARPWTYCIGSPQDRVVDNKSARTNCSDGVDYTGGGHKDVVKPGSAGDDRYRYPMSQVRRRI